MKIGVVGGGAIGLLVSGFLSKNHDVTIYVRDIEQKKALNDYGLYLAGVSKPFTVKALLLNEIRESDCYIICVKQHHIPHVLSFISDVHIRAPIIFLQNGMTHIKHFKKINHPIFVGIVEHGSYRQTNHRVQHTGKGCIKLAIYQGEETLLHFFVKQLNQQDFPFKAHEGWEHLLAEKLIINAVINPLTALFDIKNGEILTNQYIYFLARKLCREASEVLNLDHALQWERVKKVAHQTRENTSSMLADVRKGQQTENEAISGYLVNIKKENIPYTTFIYNGIKALESIKRID